LPRIAGCQFVPHDHNEAADIWIPVLAEATAPVSEDAVDESHTTTNGERPEGEDASEQGAECTIYDELLFGTQDSREKNNQRERQRDREMS